MKDQETDDARLQGTIGGMSARIGYDVRELVIDGYSWRQIHEVTAGRMTLAELFEHKPENEPIDTNKILSRLRDQRKGPYRSRSLG